MSNRKRWFRLISCLLIALLLAGNMQFTKAYAAQAPEEMSVANGYYQIATALNEKQVLDIKSGSLKDRANVQLWENHDAGQQRFYIKKLSNGYYNIQAFHSGKMVDVTGASTAIKTNVQQYKSNGNAAQQWKFLDAGNGYCYIQSRLGTYLDCEMGHSENGSNVWTYKYNGSNAQKWKLKKEGGAVFIPDKTMNTNCWMKNCSVSVRVSQNFGVKPSANWMNSFSYANGKLNFKVDSNFGNARKGKLTVKCGDDLQEITVNQSKYVKPLSSGLYTIGSKLNTKKLLDVKSQSKKDNANIQLWESTGNNNQKFQVTYLGSGYYSIINCNSGKSLDVAGKDKKKSKSNLQQYTYVKNSAQQWRIHYVGKNTFYIQSKLGTYIDAQDGKSGNGNNVWMYNFNGSKAQQWVFSKTTKKAEPASSALTSPVPSGCKFSKKTNDGGWYGYHDINRNVSKKTKVYAIADGTVTYKQAYKNYKGQKYLSSYGNFIEFKASKSSYTAKYAHLDRFVGASQKISSNKSLRQSGSHGVYKLKTKSVKRGETIGYIGTTGNSRGTHLHFELSTSGTRIDPVSVFKSLK